MNNNTIKIVAQAYYGNKVSTTIKKEDVDRFILGYMEDSIEVTEKIDRTIVHLPNLENIVLVYNRNFEERELERKEDLINNHDYELKPLAVIPELDMKLYSRCFVCRVDEDGELASLEDGDYKKFEKYLAE